MSRFFKFVAQKYSFFDDLVSVFQNPITIFKKVEQIFAKKFKPQ